MRSSLTVGSLVVAGLVVVVTACSGAGSDVLVGPQVVPTNLDSGTAAADGAARATPGGGDDGNEPTTPDGAVPGSGTTSDAGPRADGGGGGNAPVRLDCTRAGEGDCTGGTPQLLSCRTERQREAARAAGCVPERADRPDGRDVCCPATVEGAGDNDGDND